MVAVNALKAHRRNIRNSRHIGDSCVIKGNGNFLVFINPRKVDRYHPISTTRLKAGTTGSALRSPRATPGALTVNRSSSPSVERSPAERAWKGYHQRGAIHRTWSGKGSYVVVFLTGIRRCRCNRNQFLLVRSAVSFNGVSVLGIPEQVPLEFHQHPAYGFQEYCQHGHAVAGSSYPWTVLISQDDRSSPEILPQTYKRYSQDNNPPHQTYQ